MIRISFRNWRMGNSAFRPGRWGLSRFVLRIAPAIGGLAPTTEPTTKPDGAPRRA